MPPSAVVAAVAFLLVGRVAAFALPTYDVSRFTLYVSIGLSGRDGCLSRTGSAANERVWEPGAPVVVSRRSDGAVIVVGSLQRGSHRCELELVVPRLLKDTPVVVALTTQARLPVLWSPHAVFNPRAGPHETMHLAVSVDSDGRVAIPM